METEQKQPGLWEVLEPSYRFPPLFPQQPSRRGCQRMPVPSSASQLTCFILFCFISALTLLFQGD